MNKALLALYRIRGLRGPIAAILVVLIAMPLISFWAMFQISRLSAHVTTVDDARLNLSRALRYVLDEEMGIRGYVDTHKGSFLQPYGRAHPLLQTLLHQLPGRFSAAGLNSVLPRLDDIARLHAQWHRAVADPLLANPNRADAYKIEESGRKLVEHMRRDAEITQTASGAYIQTLTQRMFDVQVIAGALAVIWIAMVGTFAIILERRSLRREMELVLSLVEEREAVERLSDWRSRLLAMLAHDFKSQLAVIIGASHLLEDFPNRRGDPHMLASLRNAGYTLAEMADNAILLARAQERRLVLQRSTFDVTEIVGNVVQRYGAEREFNVHTSAPAAMIDADRSYVTRVMDNIIGNAVKYSDDPVDVDIRDAADNVTVTVCDRGIGISDSDLPHIFEEFWRSENALWNKKGSGVGLFIVKQIMEAHGGSIRVQSQLGKGTTVTLRFRRAETPCPVQLPEPVKTGT